MKEIKNELCAPINESAEEILKLRDNYTFCSLCGKPTEELFCYSYPVKDFYWVRWVCYECYEQLEIGYDCGRM